MVQKKGQSNTRVITVSLEMPWNHTKILSNMCVYLGVEMWPLDTHPSLLLCFGGTGNEPQTLFCFLFVFWCFWEVFFKFSYSLPSFLVCSVACFVFFFPFLLFLFFSHTPFYLFYGALERPCLCLLYSLSSLLTCLVLSSSSFSFFFFRYLVHVSLSSFFSLAGLIARSLAYLPSYFLPFLFSLLSPSLLAS